MKKKLALLLSMGLVVSSLVGCGNTATKNDDTQKTEEVNETATETTTETTTESSEAASEEATLIGSETAKTRFKVGTTTAPEGHYVKGLLEFQKLLEEYSNGEMTVDIYPNSQLGNERDMMENVGMGVQEMCLISTGPIPNFVSDFAVLDLPYLFESADEAYTVLDGEIGTGLLEQLTSQGIKGLGFWENGFRELTNNKKEITVPGDLAGMKIRTMENNVHMATYQTLGATATPMAWSEIFTALQQGTVDGQENPIAIIDSAKVYEVQKYVSMIDLFYSPCVLMIGESVFDGLSAEQQEILIKAADEAKVYQRNYSQNYNKDAIANMEAAGVTVTEVDKQAWKEAAQSVYDQADSLGLNADLVNQLTQ